MGKQTVVVAITEEGDGKFIVGVLRAMFDCDPAHVTELFPGHPDPAGLLVKARNALLGVAADGIRGSMTERAAFASNTLDDADLFHNAAAKMRGED